MSSGIRLVYNGVSDFNSAENEKLRELAYEKRTTKTDIVTRFIEDGIKKESS